MSNNASVLTMDGEADSQAPRALSLAPLEFKHPISGFKSGERAIRARIVRVWDEEAVSWPQHVQDSFRQSAEDLKFTHSTIVARNHIYGKRVIDGRAANWGHWRLLRCIWKVSQLSKLQSKMNGFGVENLWCSHPNGDSGGNVSTNATKPRSDLQR